MSSKPGKRPLTRKEGKLIRETAALDFTPWDPDKAGPPSREQWIEGWDNCIDSALQVAWGLVLKSKPELVGILAKMPAADVKVLLDNIQDAIERLQELTNLLEAARDRLAVATCVVAEQQTEAQA